MMRFTREGLVADGFQGFLTVGALKSPGGCDNLPGDKGVYVVIRENTESPVFLEVSCGGRHKGKQPTVSVTKLVLKWVENAQVLYFGKTHDALCERIGEYIRCGKGLNHGHWGGRLIWQLADADSLRVAWKALPSEDPADIESDLLHQFKDAHSGKLPFANLRLERRRGSDAAD